MAHKDLPSTSRDRFWHLSGGCHHWRGMEEKLDFRAERTLQDCHPWSGTQCRVSKEVLHQTSGNVTAVSLFSHSFLQHSQIASTCFDE